MKKAKDKIILKSVGVVCITCNTNFQINTTLQKDFKVDVCSHCHTFYLGTQKFESKAGRMERFRQLEQKSKNLKLKKQQQVSLTHQIKPKIKESAKKILKKKPLTSSQHANLKISESKQKNV